MDQHKAKKTNPIKAPPKARDCKNRQMWHAECLVGGPLTKRQMRPSDNGYRIAGPKDD